jgi:SSS family solute:Na+ symporter
MAVALMPAVAAGAEPRPEPAAGAGLTRLDWVIIGLYAVAVLGAGWYYSRRQKSTAEYFVGSGMMNPWLVGISLFATLLSTVSYLSYPGEAIAKGPLWLSGLAHIPVSLLIVCYLIIPAFRRQRVISAYELLENRLGYGIRALGACMFIFMRLVWMSLLVYMAAEAMSIMFGIPEEDQSKWIPWIVLGTGLVAVVYSSMGGMRAVVYTDLMQSVLLFGGALLVIATVTYHFGGFSWFPTQWQGHWDEQPIFDFDPSTRVTMVGVFIMGILWCVCTAGGDQTAVQRFMSTKDVSAARRSYVTSICAAALIMLTLFVVGFGLMAYVRENPTVLPAGMSLERNADSIFPRYIAYHLPPGVSGLIVAAMFAAGMSSIDSGVNSITAVVLTDFLDRFGLRPVTDRGHVLLAKGLAFTIGAIVVVGSSFMQHVPGNFTAVAQKTSSLFMTPIFGLFFFALFVPFARPIGVFAGALCGFATAVLIAFSGPIFGFDPVTGYDPVSFIWINPAALAVNIAVGTVVSLGCGRKSA